MLPASSSGFSVTPLHCLPLFTAQTPVFRAVADALEAQGIEIRDDDIVVVAQKIVSKAEGRTIRLRDIAPGGDAADLGASTGRDPALMQLVLDESVGVMRATPAAVIVRHRTGHVLANAGIDASNVAGGGEDSVLLWPIDPDASARGIRAALASETGAAPAVVIADSMGRAWRVGTLGTAIGCAGLAVIDDQRGQQDLFGRTLQATIVAVADAIAGAAVLAMGEGSEGTPVAIVRGCGHWVSRDDGSGMAPGLRPLAQDMFR